MINLIILHCGESRFLQSKQYFEITFQNKLMLWSFRDKFKVILIHLNADSDWLLIGQKNILTGVTGLWNDTRVAQTAKKRFFSLSLSFPFYVWRARFKIFANVIKAKAGNTVSLMAGTAGRLVISGWLEGKFLAVLTKSSEHTSVRWRRQLHDWGELKCIILVVWQKWQCGLNFILCANMHTPPPAPAPPPRHRGY